MSRYADQSSPKTIQRWIKEGRGQNRGRSYKPWLYPRDISSRGYSTRAPGQITGRMHSLLSRYERYFWQILDANPRVTDIREQYPLGLDITRAIGRTLGVEHPCDPRSKLPFVMTTDFLVSFGGGEEAAYAVKMKKDLSSRTLQKFALEEVYWRRRGVQWQIVTEDQIPSVFAKNVDWVHDGGKFGDYELTADTAIEIARALLPGASAGDTPLSRLTDQIDLAGKHEPGTALLVVRQLLAAREWTVDMHKRIDPTQVVKFEKLNGSLTALAFAADDGLKAA